MNFRRLLAALRLAWGSWWIVALKIVLATWLINRVGLHYIVDYLDRPEYRDQLHRGLGPFSIEYPALFFFMPSVLVIALEYASFRRLLALTPNPRPLIIVAILPWIILISCFLALAAALLVHQYLASYLTVISVLIAVFAIFSREKVAFMGLAYPLGISGIIFTAQSEYTRPLIIAFSIYVIIWQILRERKADRTPQSLIPHISLRALVNFWPAGKK